MQEANMSTISTTKEELHEAIIEIFKKQNNI